MFTSGEQDPDTCRRKKPLGATEGGLPSIGYTETLRRSCPLVSEQGGNTFLLLKLLYPQRFTQANWRTHDLKGKRRRIPLFSHPRTPLGFLSWQIASVEGSLTVLDTLLLSSHLCLFWTRPFADSDSGSTVSFTAPSGEGTSRVEWTHIMSSSSWDSKTFWKISAWLI